MELFGRFPRFPSFHSCLTFLKICFPLFLLFKIFLLFLLFPSFRLLILFLLCLLFLLIQFFLLFLLSYTSTFPNFPTLLVWSAQRISETNITLRGQRYKINPLIQAPPHPPPPLGPLYWSLEGYGVGGSGNSLKNFLLFFILIFKISKNMCKLPRKLCNNQNILP